MTHQSQAGPLRIFIGHDPRQPASYNVLQHSIARRSSRPVAITPLILDQLPLTRMGLTPFTFSRYLVPYLCDYQGWALFMDADILLQDDIAKLFDLADPECSLMVVKNKKRFEWASMILFNCDRCQALTPDYVETVKSEELFGFTWADKIGELPSEWNHLVGYDPEREDAKLVHYTQGVPGFPEAKSCEYNKAWFLEHANMNYLGSWQEIMGPSVHSFPLHGAAVPKFIVKQQNETLRTNIQDIDLTAIQSQAPYSRENPSANYQKRIIQHQWLHTNAPADVEYNPLDVYPGTETLNHIQGIAGWSQKFKLESVLDYGAGKNLQYGPCQVKTPQGVMPSVQAALGWKNLFCYDPAYPPLMTLPQQKFSGVLVSNVLEYCPEEDLPWVLEEIFSFATRSVFFIIRGWDSGEKLPDGSSAICTVLSSEAWRNLIFKVAEKTNPDIEPLISFQEAPESQKEVYTAS